MSVDDKDGPDQETGIMHLTHTLLIVVPDCEGPALGASVSLVLGRLNAETCGIVGYVV